MPEVTNLATHIPGAQHEADSLIHAEIEKVTFILCFILTIKIIFAFLAHSICRPDKFVIKTQTYKIAFLHWLW